ncbi:hypothetical protein JCM10908_001404 [Rhodotorula pacifica]|uniref:uncharacterized protein n=1 Tax=Rhodotorula pacifica TaxID=1495444 RepID=UPI00317D8AAA
MRDVYELLQQLPTHSVSRRLCAILLSVLLAFVVARVLAGKPSHNEAEVDASASDSSHVESTRPVARPCTTAGPVLAARVANLDLSGLTIIPITRLPRLRKKLRLPFVKRAVVVYADLTASELVFRRLKVGSASTSSRDVGREPIQVSADSVELDLTGSVGVRAGFYYEGEDERRGRAVRASGRIHVALADANAHICTRLVSRDVQDGQEALSRPGLSCRRVDFHPGHVSMLSVSGFLPFLRIETLVHHIRNTRLVRASTRRFAAFLVEEVVQGPVCSDLLGDLEGFASKHVDLQTLVDIEESARDRALTRFFQDSMQHVEPESAATTTSAFTTTSESSATTNTLRLHALVFGPIHLHSLSLPSTTSAAQTGGTVPVPVFARRDQTGLRYSILSSPILNQLTRGPPDVSFGPSAFDRIELDEVSVELEPNPMEMLEGMATGDYSSRLPDASSATRELVLRVHGLAASLSIAFRIGADLRAAPALVTGMKVLEEKGVATTDIAEKITREQPRQSAGEPDSSLQTRHPNGLDDGAADDELDGISIRLPLRWDRSSGRVLLTSRHDDEDEVTANAGPLSSVQALSRRRRTGTSARGIRLEGAFGTVAPRIKLESRLGKLLGERVVNALLEGVQTHLAALTIPLASHFLADLARQRLQRTLDSVNERLATEGGVLWTSPSPKVAPASELSVG